MSSRYSRSGHRVTTTTTTTTTDRSRPLWDPKEVLDLEYINCCVGYAASKGRRCTCAIAQVNRAKAEALLDDISRCEPEAECLQEDLFTIATCLLCVRWHRDQADRMVDEWMDLIKDTFDEEAEEEEEEEEEMEDLISIASLGASYRTPARPTPSPSIATAIRCSQTARTTTSASSPLSSSSRETTPNASRHNHTTTSSLSATPASRVPTSNTPPLSLRGSSSSSSSSSSSPSSSSSSSSSPPATPPVPPNPPRKPCTHPHVARREIDSDCAICMEPMSRSQNPVWCKIGCGRSVHKDCFATWKTERSRIELSVNCTICRTRWDDTECDC